MATGRHVDPRRHEGRWFTWLVIVLVGTVVADGFGVLPIGDDPPRPKTRVLGEVITRVPTSSTTTPTTVAASLSTAVVPTTTTASTVVPSTAASTTTVPRTTTTRRPATTTTSTTIVEETTTTTSPFGTTTLPFP